ncbi:MAG: transglutaminase-like cysteine peptidase [Alphaproteobacteria bacterium]|nr:transglutaminase-like cysteine peptidase [Alphaproteobacteria bacterium]
MSRLSTFKTMLALATLMNINTVMAKESSGDLFIDQLNGMTRLERLVPTFSLKSNLQIRNRILTDASFVNKLFNASSGERLTLAPSLSRRTLFNNGKGRSLKVVKRTIAPSGLFRLCKDKLLTVCQKNKGHLKINEKGEVLMNSQLFSDLKQVNDQINKSIRPEYEKAGTKDNWQVNLAQGDCEDFALTKKAKLIKQGWPSNALLITIVDTERGERHAVLTVSTNQGEYILDNILKRVINVESSKYTFLTRQGSKEGYSWAVLA